MFGSRSLHLLVTRSCRTSASPPQGVFPHLEMLWLFITSTETGREPLADPIGYFDRILHQLGLGRQVTTNLTAESNRHLTSQSSCGSGVCVGISRVLCSGSQRAATKQVSTGAAVSSDPWRERDLLPSLCGCCQHEVPGGLLDLGPWVLADCWLKVALSSEKLHPAPWDLDLPNAAIDSMDAFQDGHYNFIDSFSLHGVLVKSQPQVLSIHWGRALYKGCERQEVGSREQPRTCPLQPWKSVLHSRA